MKQEQEQEQENTEETEKEEVLCFWCKPRIPAAGFLVREDLPASQMRRAPVCLRHKEELQDHGDTWEPMPKKNPYQPTGTEARVCADIAARQQLGIAKYGTTVERNPLPLREWLRHHYQELLDAAVYARRELEEMDRLAWLSEMQATGNLIEFRIKLVGCEPHDYIWEPLRSARFDYPSSAYRVRDVPWPDHLKPEHP